MASLLVLVAHSGRTLQLDVQPSTRVDAVQHALVSFTGIPVADQIAMYQGARLDPAKPLGAYRLPVDSSAAALEDHPVFLYCRSYLKPGAALPPPEALPPLQVQVPPLAEVNLAHPLHSAPSPLVRALPDYERHFQHHWATTRAYWEVAQARLQRCRQLLSEQEVQARAADAARANVEAHYNYILNSYQTFLYKYNTQHAAHAGLLATFPSDLAALEDIELHPALQQQQLQLQQLQQPHNEHQQPHQQEQLQPHNQQQQQQQQQRQQQQQLLLLRPQGEDPVGSSSPLPLGALSPAEGGGAVAAAVAAAATAAVAAPGPRRLADLYPVQRLREWAETCSRSHASFGAKVSELEALFQLLRKDVEGLFMQAPSVDLDALGRQMAEHEALLDEHSSMVQVLSKDLRTVRTLVEDVVRQLGSAAGGPPGVGGGGLRQGALNDAAAAMEAIHETHRNRVLPRLAHLDSQLASFAARVEGSKVAMSRDVLLQLQRISGQQSRIRDMKNKLAAFHEVLRRQEAAFAELRVVHRLPSAYRALLAEVVRRSAWHQLYCGQACRLAEHMARFRDKEAGRRSSFASHVARYIPPDLLTRAGLVSEPPHCQVTVPPPDVPLIAVAMADLQRLSYLDERMVLAASTSLRASAAASLHPPQPQHQHLHPHSQQHHLHHQNASAVTDASASRSQPLHPQPQPQHHHLQHQHPQRTQPHHQAQLGSHLAGGAGGAASMPCPGTLAVLDADPPGPIDGVAALEMENARLRAELANHISAACIRELNAAMASGISANGEAQQQQPTAAPAAGDSTAAQPSSSLSATAAAVASATPRQARVSGGGSGGGGPSPPAAAGSPSASSALNRRDPTEILAAMQRALGMKDDLIRHQQREISALAARAEAYEERITALEALLTQRAMGTGSCAGDVASASARHAGASIGRGAAVGCSSGPATEAPYTDAAMLASLAAAEEQQQPVTTSGTEASAQAEAARADGIGGAIAVAGASEGRGLLGSGGAGASGGSGPNARGGSRSRAGPETAGAFGSRDAAALTPDGDGGDTGEAKLGRDSSVAGKDGQGRDAAATGLAPDGGGPGGLDGGGSASGQGKSEIEGLVGHVGGHQGGGGGGGGGGTGSSETAVVLSVDVDMHQGLVAAEGAASISTSPLSPFALLATQQKPPLQQPQEQEQVSCIVDDAAAAGARCEREGQEDLSGKGGGTPGLGSRPGSRGVTAGDGDGGKCTVMPLYGSRAGSAASQPQRGSSGPQAIPLAPGGLRRGGGGGVEEPTCLPYERRDVPMSIGSLPFATSLPGGSTLASRMTPSPSGGIGLGLALGLGLTSLVEGPRQPLASREMDGSSGNSSRGSSSWEVSDDRRRRTARVVAEEEEEEGDRARVSGCTSATSGGGGLLKGSSGGASSGALQFQPSWSAPVSSDSATGGGGTAPAAAPATDADGGAGVSREEEGMAAADGAAGIRRGVDGDATVSGDDGGGRLTAAAAAAAALGQQDSSVESPQPQPQSGPPTATAAAAGPSEVAEEAALPADAEAATAAAAAANDDEGIGKRCNKEYDGSDDGALAEDVPDIDEVIDDSDGDGAWEVASAAAALAVATTVDSGTRLTGGGSSGSRSAVAGDTATNDLSVGGTLTEFIAGGGNGGGDGSGGSAGGPIATVDELEDAQTMTGASSGYESISSFVEG